MGKRHRHKISLPPIENAVEVKLLSGYVVKIHPLSPYYKDLMDDNMPIPEYPRRIITLASGDALEWDYTPSEVEPAADDPEYDLWIRWHVVDRQRNDMEILRKRARQDFLLANCVRVVSGDESVDDTEWANRVEAAFPDYHVPTHPGKRTLIFLKTQVITSTMEMDHILQICFAQEITMQGIMNSLQGFPVEVEQGEPVESGGVIATEQSGS